MSVTNNVKFLIVDDASFMRIVLKDILISHGLASQIYEVEMGWLQLRLTSNSNQMWLQWM